MANFIENQPLVRNEGIGKIKIVKRLTSVSAQSRSEQTYVVVDDCFKCTEVAIGHILLNNDTCTMACSVCQAALFYYCINVHTPNIPSRVFLPDNSGLNVAQNIFAHNHQPGDTAHIYMEGAECHIVLRKFD